MATLKTSTTPESQLQATENYKQRRRNKGQKVVSVWAYPDDVKELHAFAKKLLKEREKNPAVTWDNPRIEGGPYNILAQTQNHDKPEKL